MEFIHSTEPRVKKQVVINIFQLHL